jgi:predicted nucleic acid-binding protein
MTFDPRSFRTSVIADTCSVSNVLSANKLYQAALAARVSFSITPTVVYECMHKPRKQLDAKAVEMRARLSNARARGNFSIASCSLDTLFSLSQTAPVGLSSGEISSIAAAIENQGTFMTDEKQARHHARERLNLEVETTPRLYGWLHFHRHLIDADHAEIVCEHERFERRPITRFLEDAYYSALQYRLMQVQK